VRARPATLDDVEAICCICADPLGEVDAESFYTPARVAHELDAAPPSWGGWFVTEADVVIAAGGGGMTGPITGELFVLYVDPARRGEGAGTALLAAITAQQVELGATEQWVAVGAGNIEAIAFYEARGFARRGTQQLCTLDGQAARYWRSVSRQSAGMPPSPS